MSVAVAIEALREKIAEFGPTAYLVTVGADANAHVVSVRVHMVGDRIGVAAGRTSRANARVNSGATLLWPAAAGQPYSLIVDGQAETSDADDGEFVIDQTRAVLHRVADATQDVPSCVPIEDTVP